MVLKMSNEGHKLLQLNYTLHEVRCNTCTEARQIWLFTLLASGDNSLPLATKADSSFTQI
jgi:hypothetical protein